MDTEGGDEEVDIYDDLPDFNLEASIQKLEVENRALTLKVKDLSTRVTELETHNNELNRVNKNLRANISALLKTVQQEIQRKDRTINELRQEREDLFFRRKKIETDRPRKFESDRPNILDSDRPKIPDCPKNPDGNRLKNADSDSSKKPDCDRPKKLDGDRTKIPDSDRLEPDCDRPKKLDGDRTKIPDSDRLKKPDSDRPKNSRIERSKKPDIDLSNNPDSDRSKKPDSDCSKKPDSDRPKNSRIERSKKPDIDLPNNPDSDRPKKSDIDLPNNPDSDRSKKPDSDCSKKPGSDRPKNSRIERSKKPDIELSKKPESDLPNNPDSDRSKKTDIDLPNNPDSDNPKISTVYRLVPLSQSYDSGKDDQDKRSTRSVSMNLESSAKRDALDHVAQANTEPAPKIPSANSRKGNNAGTGERVVKIAGGANQVDPRLSQNKQVETTTSPKQQCRKMSSGNKSNDPTTSEETSLADPAPLKQQSRKMSSGGKSNESNDPTTAEQTALAYTTPLQQPSRRTSVGNKSSEPITAEQTLLSDTTPPNQQLRRRSSGNKSNDDLGTTEQISLGDSTPPRRRIRKTSAERPFVKTRSSARLSAKVHSSQDISNDSIGDTILFEALKTESKIKYGFANSPMPKKLSPFQDNEKSLSPSRFSVGSPPLETNLVSTPVSGMNSLLFGALKGTAASSSQNQEAPPAEQESSSRIRGKPARMQAGFGEAQGEAERETSCAEEEDARREENKRKEEELRKERNRDDNSGKEEELLRNGIAGKKVRPSAILKDKVDPLYPGNVEKDRQKISEKDEWRNCDEPTLVKNVSNPQAPQLSERKSPFELREKPVKSQDRSDEARRKTAHGVEDSNRDEIRRNGEESRKERKLDARDEGRINSVHANGISGKEVGPGSSPNENLKPGSAEEIQQNRSSLVKNGSLPLKSVNSLSTETRKLGNDDDKRNPDSSALQCDFKVRRRTRVQLQIMVKNPPCTQNNKTGDAVTSKFVSESPTDRTVPSVVNKHSIKHERLKSPPGNTGDRTAVINKAGHKDHDYRSPPRYRNSRRDDIRAHGVQRERGFRPPPLRYRQSRRDDYRPHGSNYSRRSRSSSPRFLSNRRHGKKVEFVRSAKLPTDRKEREMALFGNSPDRSPMNRNPPQKPVVLTVNVRRKTTVQLQDEESKNPPSLVPKPVSKSLSTQLVKTPTDFREKYAEVFSNTGESSDSESGALTSESESHSRNSDDSYKPKKRRKTNSPHNKTRSKKLCKDGS